MNLDYGDDARQAQHRHRRTERAKEKVLDALGDRANVPRIAALIDDMTVGEVESIIENPRRFMSSITTDRKTVQARIDHLTFILDARGADMRQHLSEAARLEIARISRADVQRQLDAAKADLAKF